MKIVKTGTIDEIRDSIKKDGQEKPEENKYAAEESRITMKRLEETGKSLRENFRPSDEKGLLYKNESRDGMTDEEIDYFNLCMNDLSPGDNGNGLEILSNVKQYIEAKGYEYDTRNCFTAESYINPDVNLPAESFFYTKGNEALALTASGYKSGSDPTRYSDFRIEKCSIDKLDRMKANPPKTEGVGRLPSRTSKPDYSVDSHIADNNPRDYWNNDETNRPWWEIGNDMQKILSDAEVPFSISPLANEMLSSLGYECHINGADHCIDYVREEPSRRAGSIASHHILRFDLDSRDVTLHFFRGNGTSITPNELKAIGQQLDYMNRNEIKHEQEKSADEMLADLGFTPAENSENGYLNFEKDLYEDWFGTIKDYVAFDSQSQSEKIIFARNDEATTLDVTCNADEIEAISKKAEELGWNKEKGSRSKSRSEDDYEMDI